MPCLPLRKRRRPGVQAPTYLVPLTCWLLLVATAAHAQPGEPRYQLTVTPQAGGSYLPDRWTPLAWTFENFTQTDIDGSGILNIQSGDRPAVFQVPVRVPANSRVTVISLAYLPENDAEGSATTAPLAQPEWHDASGSRLARTELRARGLFPANDADQPGIAVLLIDGNPGRRASPKLDLDSFADSVRSAADFPLAFTSTNLEHLPRHRAGYDGIRAVVFSGVAPEQLDLSQRRAMIGYVESGGILVLAGPTESSAFNDTWIEALAPVRPIGQRLATSIAPSPSEADNPIAFIEPAEICEALPGDGISILADDSYVHAAYRETGLGRVAFTSFPVNALNARDPRTIEVWRELFNADAAEWPAPALARNADTLLQEMLGVAAPPWSAAAALAGGYVLAVVTIQLAAGVARRPVAFAACTVLAVVAAASLLLVTTTRQASAGISEARITTIALGQTGGGLRTDRHAFLGATQNPIRLTPSGAALLRALRAAPQNPPVLRQLPNQAVDATVLPARVEQIWEADRPAAGEIRLQADLRVTAAGLELAVDNRTAHGLLAPLFTVGRTVYRLPDLPPGRSNTLLGSANAPGDFGNSPVISSQAARLRARIAELSLQRTTRANLPTARSAAVLAWIPDDPHDEPLLEASTPPVRQYQQTLLRSPVRMLRSTPGERIHVPAELVRIDIARAPGLPYDPARGAWLESRQDGAYLIGFAIPQAVGRLDRVEAHLRLAATARGHTIIVRRGQCVGGEPRDHPEAPEELTLARTEGAREIRFQLSPDDCDASGQLWLRVSVEIADPAIGPAPAWKINDFLVAFEGTVAGDAARN